MRARTSCRRFHLLPLRTSFALVRVVRTTVQIHVPSGPADDQGRDLVTCELLAIDRCRRSFTWASGASIKPDTHLRGCAEGASRARDPVCPHQTVCLCATMVGVKCSIRRRRRSASITSGLTDSRRERRPRSGGTPMNRIAIFATTTLLFVSSCAHNPYRNRVVVDGAANPQRYFFAYGKFCGAGHPRLRPPYADRTAQIVASWPPIDHIDAICYAHDLCYERGGSPVTCDHVLQLMIIDSQSRVAAPGCWNLATDMTVAFFGKFWGRGLDGPETGANRTVRFFLGLPTAAFWYVLKAPLRPFLRWPDEGTCSWSSAPDDVVRDFARRYEAARDPERPALAIPLPPLAPK